MTGFRVRRGGRAGALRRHARPVVLRQGHRRRASRRRLRRTAPTSWTGSPRRVRSTRPGRSRAIRSRCAPGSRRSTSSPTPGTYERLEAISARGSRPGLTAAAKDAGVPAVVNRVGSMLTGFLHRPGRSSTTHRRRAPTRSVTRGSSTRCSTAASTSPRRSSRRRSSSTAHDEAIRRSHDRGGSPRR